MKYYPFLLVSCLMRGYTILIHFFLKLLNKTSSRLTKQSGKSKDLKIRTACQISDTVLSRRLGIMAKWIRLQVICTGKDCLVNHSLFWEQNTRASREWSGIKGIGVNEWPTFESNQKHWIRHEKTRKSKSQMSWVPLNILFLNVLSDSRMTSSKTLVLPLLKSVNDILSSADCQADCDKNKSLTQKLWF
jgi:hypothetical protein